MGTLPPLRAREFEELITVPRGGMEYMAGGTGFHPTIGQRALVGKSKSNSKSNTKSKSPGEEDEQRQDQQQNLTPTPRCA